MSLSLVQLLSNQAWFMREGEERRGGGVRNWDASSINKLFCLCCIQSNANNLPFFGFVVTSASLFAWNGCSSRLVSHNLFFKVTLGFGLQTNTCPCISGWNREYKTDSLPSLWFIFSVPVSSDHQSWSSPLKSPPAPPPPPNPLTHPPSNPHTRKQCVKEKCILSLKFLQELML